MEVRLETLPLEIMLVETAPENLQLEMVQRPGIQTCLACTRKESRPPQGGRATLAAFKQLR